MPIGSKALKQFAQIIQYYQIYKLSSSPQRTKGEERQSLQSHQHCIGVYTFFENKNFKYTNINVIKLISLLCRNQRKSLFSSKFSIQAIFHCDQLFQSSQWTKFVCFRQPANSACNHRVGPSRGWTCWSPYFCIFVQMLKSPWCNQQGAVYAADLQ